MTRSRKPDVVHANDATLGNRVADWVASSMGSWRFVIGQNLIIGVWCVVNVVALALRWDPYPFILLNLVMSWQAANAAPVIMMSQNRAAAKDHLRDDHEADEVESIVNTHAVLLQLNTTQLEILKRLDELQQTERA